MQNYEQKATDFLNKNNITIDITFKKNDFYFNDDKDKRDIYNITIKKGNRSINFDFGQSLNNSGFKVIYEYINSKNTFSKFKKTFIDSYLHTSKNIEKDLTKLFYQNLTLKDSDLKDIENCNFVLKELYFIASVSIDSFELAKKPTAFDVLSCLTYSDPGTFEDFCLEFDFNNDSIKHLELYKRVVKEYQQILTIFNDQEIQETQDFL